MKVIKAIILLDPSSRNRIQLETLRASSSEYELINTIGELTDDLVAQTRNFIFFEGFFESKSSIATLLLYKQIYKLNLFYYGCKSFWVAAIQDCSVCMEGDLDSFSAVMLEALLYQSHEEERQKSFNHDYVESLAQMVLDKSAELTHENVLARGVLNSRDEILELAARNQELQKLVLHDEAIIGRLRGDNERLTKGYLELVERINKHNRELEDYEILLTKNSYIKINLKQFQNRPTIIYLKQFEEFLGLDILIDAVVNTFNTKLDKTVKVIRLFDSENCSGYRTLEPKYLKLRNQYTIVELHEQDWIAKLGQYQMVMETLLENKVEVDVLIVVDAKTSTEPVLQGRFIHFNLCREWEHGKVFGLDEMKTIFNKNPYRDDEKEEQSLELLWDQELPDSLNGMSKQKKMNRLASTSVVQRIVEEYRRDTNQF